MLLAQSAGNTFRYPSLVALETLELHHHYFDDDDFPYTLDDTDLHLPFHLRALRVDLEGGIAHLYQSIVTASKLSLTSFRIGLDYISPRDFEGTFPTFHPIATNLKSFVLRGHTFDKLIAAFEPALSNFLRLATSLTRFGLSLFQWTTPHPQDWHLLRELLDSINSPLRRLEIRLIAVQLRHGFFQSLEEAMRQSLSLNQLEKLDFSNATLEELRAVKSWDTIDGLLSARGISLVTR